MATDFSIALGELLDKTGANLDFLREAVQLLAQELKRISTSHVGHAGRHHRSAHPEAASRQLLPEFARAPPASGESPCRRGSRSLHPRREHPHSG